jgi:signal transduction histidine kinase
MAFGGSYTRNIVLAFSLVAVGFLASSFYLGVRNLGIDAKTLGLLTNSLPSLEHLDAACDGLRDIEVSAEALPELPENQRAAAALGLEARWNAVEREIAAYRETPDYEGEWELYSSSIPAQLEALHLVDVKLRAKVTDHDLPAARDVVDREIRPATRKTIASLRKLMELNAQHAFEDARTIAALRKSGDRLSVVLNGAALLIGAFATFWVLGVFRAYGRLLEAHGALVEQRASDLEQFGRRVAHDLLSPLSALSFCLSAFKKPSLADPKLEDALARAKACIVRAQGLVDGVFEFSRAGGKPKVGEDADVAGVIDETVAEVLASKDEGGPEITVESFAACKVGCSPGVLTAIVSNLLRNAMKYMSDSAVKKITVRVLPNGEDVRIEVEDTGPGVPVGLESVIFEPYVRAQGVTQPGLGLGLATVKRFCVAHGGQVGVRSSPGLGSVFWFTLPKRG